MKILYICNEYPPHKHGGIGSFTRDIAEGLASGNQDVTVWGLYDTIPTEVNEKINDVKVTRVPFPLVKSRFKHLFFIFILNLKLRKFLKEHTFDIIECQEWQGLLPVGINHPGFVIRLHGAAVFFDKLLNRPGNRLMHWLEKRTIKNANNIVAVSDYCGKITLSLVKTHKKYTVIYNGVNKTKLNRFKEANYVRYSIVFANSVLPKKGVLELAKAFNLVKAKFPAATLTIIGKLGYQENGINIEDLIKKKIDPQGLPNVTITGWLENADDVFHQLAGAHICCYPSHMEGFGIAPVEAMALGKAVLFMKNGPGPEVIEDGISGILANCANSCDIASKIITLFEGKMDAGYLGVNAEQRVEKFFDLKNVFVPNNISYYRKILSIED
ncbi:MAG: glycosyl transferase group 1 [Ferruginibacter sp.]|nr:glycosyl transferase group 1 [Ferruginibacter sp.]